MTSISQKIEGEEPCGMVVGDGDNMPLFIGHRVNVYVGPFGRTGQNGFVTSIAVIGQLEAQDDEEGNPTLYRIVSEDDDSVYAYFRQDDVVDVRYGVYEVDPADFDDGPPPGMYCVISDAGSATYWTLAEQLSEKQTAMAVVRISVPRATEPEVLDRSDEMGDNPPDDPSSREAS